MRIINAFILIAAAGAFQASTAAAQSDVAPRAAVSLVGGVGATTQTTGVRLGGSGLFDLTDRVSMEVEGTYLDRGAGASALSATGSLLVNLVSSNRQVVPYAAAGGGVYRAAFELANPLLLGPVGTQFAAGTTVCPAPGTGIGPGPGTGFGPGTGTCPATTTGYWGVGQMSGFYARRLGPMAVPAGAWDDRHFTDPAASIGGGVRFNVNERVMVRPDLRALIVFADGDTHTLMVFGVHAGYRF